MNHSFIGESFVDGDRDWDAPKWRLKLDKEMLQGEAIDHEKERESHQYISETEIGLKHPKNNTVVKLCDSGAIEMFVNEDTGLRLDNHKNAMLIYSDSIHMVAKKLSFHTKTDGLLWNGHALNAELYYEDDNNNPPLFLSAEGKAYPLFAKKERDSLYDEDVVKLLANLGMEVVKR